MIRVIWVMILASFSCSTVAAAFAHRAYILAEGQGIFSPYSARMYTAYKTRYYRLGAVTWCFYTIAACFGAVRLLAVDSVWAAIGAALLVTISYVMAAFAHAMAKAAIIWRDSQRDTTHLDSAS